MTKGTKQIGKTLTAISDSPDKRAQGLLSQVHARQFYHRQNRREKAKQLKIAKQGKQPDSSRLVAGGSLGLDTGKFWDFVRMDLSILLLCSRS